MFKRLLIISVVALFGCSDDSHNNNRGSDGGGGPPGGGGMFPPGGVSFPWPVFDGTIPDTPEASGGGKTWYADPVNGSDSADGTSFATAKKTLNAVLTKTSLAAGDTVLLGGGIYREYPEWSNGPSGKAGAPITIASYGRGTGAPILDGGVKPNSWTKYTAQGQTTVWQSSTAGTIISGKEPVLGIYVNTGMDEFALRETVHGQVEKYINDALPPNQTQTGIHDHSSNFYFDAGANLVYADFGSTLGDGDPNQADISLVYDSTNSGGGHQLLVYLNPQHSYFKFVGLTIRAGSWSGVYTESSGHIFDHCDIKFNGGAAILFSYSGMVVGSDNTVTMTRIWMNILQNWPRFNNGYTSGGWPAAIDWNSQSNGLAEGNVVYMNGGEGLTVGNSDLSGSVSMNNVVRHNIVFDNFSVNLYVNNTQNVKIDQNFIFQHPRDITQTFDGLFAASPGYDQDFGKRITPVNLSLGDEPGSAFDGQAHLANITVTNNVLAGCKFAFEDYDDGTTGPGHGLKNSTIANNTFILAGPSVPGQAPFGWLHAPNTDASVSSILKNNLFVTTDAGDHFEKVPVGAGAGIDDDYNLYAGPGNWADNMGEMDFAAWKRAYKSWDQHSLQADAMLQDQSEFAQTATEKFVYDWAKAAPKAALGGGTALQSGPDFSGAKRGSSDIGALSPR